MILFRHSVGVVLLTCWMCAAQSIPSDLSHKIERHVRSTYNLPADVNISIGALRPSEFANYNQVTVKMESGDRKEAYEFIVSKDYKTLLKLTKIDLTVDPYSEVMKKITLSGRPVRGNKEAKVVVVSFDDFECPFCARLHQTLFPLLLKEYGDRVQFVYKDYPLSDIHPWATHAAIDANCLGAQSADAYWEFADYVHGNQGEVNSEKGREAQFAVLDGLAGAQGQKHGLNENDLQSCLKAQNEDEIAASKSEGASIGVGATPTVFVNGEKVYGAASLGEIRAAIDLALRDASLVTSTSTSDSSADGLEKQK